MKDILVSPCEMPKMDDDETPYMPMWRVVINGKPHRKVLEEADNRPSEEKIELVVSSKSIH